MKWKYTVHIEVSIGSVSEYDGIARAGTSTPFALSECVSECVSPHDHINELPLANTKNNPTTNNHIFYILIDGFGLTDSGSRVVRLFRSRKWCPLSKDSLLPYSFFWATIAVGLCTGLFAVLMEQTAGMLTLPVVLNFAIGVAVGSAVSAILFFGVIGSAVNTVLTCFAVSPTDLDKNHPAHGEAMTEAWSRKVWE
jgi:Plasma-membrane choline transporter